MPDFIHSSDLSLRGVNKAYGATPVLHDIDLRFRAGRSYAILGPSGCGKTTLLRLIAGFERPDSGLIEGVGRRFAGPQEWVPPHERGIGYVPQEGALFPHLSVADNIGFGLRKDGQRQARIDALLGLIGMTGFAARMPHQLSGGQLQRVALARALAPSPTFVLFDEPFNALDATLRQTLCLDVRAALNQTGATGIVVTHDRQEAFSFADEIIVLQAGRVIQVDTPAGLYTNPVDATTAALVGDTVFLPGTVHGDHAETPLGIVLIAHRYGVTAGRDSRILLRPEQITVSPGLAPNATVEAALYLGESQTLTCRVGEGRDLRIAARCPSSLPCPPVGSRLALSIVGSGIAYTP